MSDPVRHKAGVPTAEDFSSGAGTPIVINTTTGKAYVLSDAGVVTDLSGAATVSDGDKGDVTVSGGGAIWTIDNGAVTFAKTTGVAASSHTHTESDVTGLVADLLPKWSRSFAMMGA